MFHCSIQPIKSSFESLALRLVTAETTAETVMLSGWLREGEIGFMASCPTFISRIEGPRELFKAGLFDSKIHGAFIQSSLPPQLMSEASFNQAAVLLHEFHKAGQISHADFAEHMEMVNLYQCSFEVEALETYLLIEGLTEVAYEFKCHAQPAEVMKLWSLLWPTILKQSRKLDP